MAQPQVKPTSGGAFNNVTGNGKSTTGITNLAPYAQQQVIFAANLYLICGGQASATKTRADKQAAAVGRVLQWA
jgi:hypothetical protein